MEFNYLQWVRKNNVGIVTLNSPQTRNSLSESMGEEFQTLMNDCKNDGELRVLILTGAGTTFCSGGDFGLLQQNTLQTYDDNIDTMERFYQYYLGIAELEIPTIASMNGAAIGAGLCLAAACDFRVASPGAKMGMTFVKLGLHPGMAGTYFLPRIVGMSHALDLFVTGKIVDGEEAYRIGLVNYLARNKPVMETSLELANTIAGNGPIAVKQVKKAIMQGSHWNLPAALKYEARAQAHCYGSDDFREGLNAVRSKSSPSFRGR